MIKVAHPHYFPQATSLSTSSGLSTEQEYNPTYSPSNQALGLVGGIVQDRMGDSFGAGFLVGSLGSYLGSLGNARNANELIGNTAREAIVGGTISVVGEGKFANGAQTGCLGICLMKLCMTLDLEGLFKKSKKNQKQV
ncbi:hypothetical protein MS2017_0810 [Bathymodiolus thermophilus thioautotrophic gill symbiont]|uniref:Uncharacterized protein n=1 Tax=Bathymodiolus thermophilus thioautotrophic gill symbiont TaxID=2360 RepID=A0A3G3ILE7_9GAMM|nr:hypothetical protein [Bathymodiolus thermophilus thioautotrophic gill symbiont]AYQ56538.1 hypothetical protein MS2017_0810 [Bathymodiolus thermophilus thioautotrophic gill symbiont]